MDSSEPGQPVAQLQAQVRMCHEVHSRTVDACHCGVEVVAEVELAQRLAVHLGLGDQHASADKLLLVGAPVHVDRFAHQCRDGVDVLGRSHDEHLVVQVERGGAVDEHVVALVGVEDDARDDEVPLGEVSQLLDGLSVNARVGHLQGETSHGELLQLSQSALGLFLLLCGLDAQEVAQEDEGQDDADHTHGIGHGVAHGDVGCVYACHAEVGLLCGSQSGRVGHGTRENAHEGGDGRVGGAGDDHRHHQAEGDGDQREHVERQPSLLKGREETGTHRQANGIDEEYQAKLPEEVEQLLVEVHAEVAEDHTDE